MDVNTKDLISISDANRVGISRLVADAEDGRNLVVLRNSRPAAAIVSIESIERLQRVEELEEDLRLLVLAIARQLTDDGARHSLDDVLAELDVDPDAVNGEEDEQPWQESSSPRTRSTT